MNKNLVIFDLDGTLVDSPSGIVETFTDVLFQLNARPCDASTIRETIGLPLEQALSRLLNVQIDHELVAQGLKQYQISFKEFVLPTASKLVFPGVENGLMELQYQGFLLAIATSKFNSSAETLLKATGLRKYFELIIGADQVKFPKPHPEVGQLIMKKLDVLPERAIMIGDTTHDLLMAEAAGIRSIAVTYGVHSLPQLEALNPTWIAHSFEEVMKWINVSYSEIAKNLKKQFTVSGSSLEESVMR